MRSAKRIAIGAILAVSAGAAQAEPPCAPNLTTQESMAYLDCIKDDACDPGTKWPAYVARQDWLNGQTREIACDLAQNHPGGRYFDDLVDELNGRMTRSCNRKEAEISMKAWIWTNLSSKTLEADDRRFDRNNALVRPGERADMMRCR